MRGRGNVTMLLTAIFNRGAALVLTLALILAWPVMGAGSRGGDDRAAMSLAVRVDASASLHVGAKLEGRIWPGGNFVGRPHS